MGGSLIITHNHTLTHSLMVLFLPFLRLLVLVQQVSLVSELLKKYREEEEVDTPKIIEVRLC